MNEETIHGVLLSIITLDIELSVGYVTMLGLHVLW